MCTTHLREIIPVLPLHSIHHIFEDIEIGGFLTRSNRALEEQSDISSTKGVNMPIWNPKITEYNQSAPQAPDTHSMHHILQSNGWKENQLKNTRINT